ncbi:MAG: hypothetical protein VXX82_01060 [Verrucomicrobiota bacterium]|nr:hypothetical protein [Verrucomicrobiota bacterium]
MKNSSKLALSQSLVAVPAAFSATTYNINETLSFSDYAGTEDTFITALFFDAETGSFQKIVDDISSTSPTINPGMDVAISLFRATGSSGTYSKASGKSYGSKGTFKALTGKSKSSEAKGLPINPDWSLYGDGLKASSSSPLAPSYGTFFGLAGPSSPLVDYFNSLPSASSGTHYIGFTSDFSDPDHVELYAEISYIYTGASLFADSVLVEKFVVGDPGEELLDYTLVPENKHSAAMLALLAGSAAVYSRRRKAS